MRYGPLHLSDKVWGAGGDVVMWFEWCLRGVAGLCVGVAAEMAVSKLRWRWRAGCEGCWCECARVPFHAMVSSIHSVQTPSSYSAPSTTRLLLQLLMYPSDCCLSLV